MQSQNQYLLTLKKSRCRLKYIPEKNKLNAYFTQVTCLGEEIVISIGILNIVLNGIDAGVARVGPDGGMVYIHYG